MAKRTQKTRVRSAEPKTSVSASPTRFCLTISMQPLDQDIIESKMIDIPFPCTLAELVYQLASVGFSVCEELAAKAGVKFLPAKELIP